MSVFTRRTSLPRRVYPILHQAAPYVVNSVLIFGYQSQTRSLNHEYKETIPRKAMQNHLPVLNTLSPHLMSMVARVRVESIRIVR